MSNAFATRCSIAGHQIGWRGKKGQERVSLTDLYKAAGNPAHKDPSQWLRLPDTADFLDFQCKALDVEKSHIVKTRRGGTGGGGGSWAHWVVGIRYAAYLSKQLEDELIRAWRQLKEEERDPELAADMGFRRVMNYYRKLGYSELEAEEMAAKRLISKAHRNLLTGEWQRRGAQQPDFAKLTNAGYLGLYNKTASQIRQECELSPKANVRDHMGLVQLAETSYHEALTREQLQQQNVYGVPAMAQISHATGKKLAQAVDGIRGPGRCRPALRVGPSEIPVPISTGAAMV